MTKYNISLVIFFVFVAGLAALCFYASGQTQGFLLAALATIGAILLAYLLGCFGGWLSTYKKHLW